MGAVSAAAAGLSGAAGIASGAAKFFEGRRMQRKSQEALDRFQWQNLENPYESLQVSTLGADLQREEAARATATNVDALQQAGARGLIGGLGRVQRQNTLMNREIGADLDMQQKRIDEMTAGQDVMNQQMIERRQENELAGIGQQMRVGMDTKYLGIDQGVNALGSAITGFGGMLGGGKPTTETQGNLPQATPTLSQNQIDMFSRTNGRMGRLNIG